MKNTKNNSIKKNFKKEIINNLIIDGNHCITFNKKQDIPIWNYILREDKINIFVFDEDDNTIYDGLLIEAPNKIFQHGDSFSNISFKDLSLDENIVSRKNFFLFENQLLEKGAI